MNINLSVIIYEKKQTDVILLEKMLFNKIFENYMFYNQTDKVIICMNDLDVLQKKKRKKRKKR